MLEPARSEAPGSKAMLGEECFGQRAPVTHEALISAARLQAVGPQKSTRRTVALALPTTQASKAPGQPIQTGG